MPNPKHKIFLIPVLNESKISFEQTALNTINTFLSESNIVYINHSISVVSFPVIEYDNLKTYNNYLTVSLIYKDLSETDLDLKKVSKKTKEIIKETIGSGDIIPMPDMDTDFDKKIKESQAAKSTDKDK